MALRKKKSVKAPKEPLANKINDLGKTMFKLKKSGWSYRKLAEHFGIEDSEVRAGIKKYSDERLKHRKERI